MKQTAALLFLAGVALLTQGLKAQKLVCYVELWASTRFSPNNYDLEDIPDNTCDYVILMYLTLDPEKSTLKLHTGYTPVKPETLRKAEEIRERSPNAKILLSVGGWEDGVAKYSEMISDSSKRATFVESVADYLDEYNLDGIELHWLYPGTVWRGGRGGDREGFLQLVKELTTALKPKGRIVTASVPPDRASMEAGYNVPRLNSLLHQMHVRTIDLRGDWTHAADNPSPLYSKYDDGHALRHLNVNDSLTMWINAGASAKKVIPTYPLFGRSYTLRNARQSQPGSAIAGPGKQTPFLQAPGLLAYFEICDNLQNKRFGRYFESVTETPYAVGGDQWVGYDDEESLQKKIKRGSALGVSGVALYAVSMDDFRGTCGQKHFLVKKVRSYLN